jgi:hypothetical protein
MGGGGISAIEAGYGSGSLDAAAAVMAGAAQADATDKLAASEQEAAAGAAGAAGSGGKAQLRTSQTLSGSQVRGGGAGTGSSSVSHSLSGSEAGAGSKVPQVKAGNLGAGNNVDAFKTGRAGAMGGFNAPGRGSGSGGSGQQFAGSTANLIRAHYMSSQGSRTSVRDAMAGGNQEAAAFDGSEEGPAVELQGDNVQQASLSALKNYAGKDPKLQRANTVVDNLANDIYNDQMTAYNAQKTIGKKMFMMMGIAVLGGAAAYFLAKTNTPWGRIAAWVAAGIAIAGMLYMVLHDIKAEADTLDSLQHAGGNGKAMMTQAWMSFGMLAAGVLLAAAGGNMKNEHSILSKNDWLKKIINFGIDKGGGGLAGGIVNSGVNAAMSGANAPTKPKAPPTT